MKLYHVTLMRNYEQIKEDGLIPMIGERSKEFGEKEPCVYLFPSLEDMETALLQWLGEWYFTEYEDESLAILEVNLPEEFPISLGGAEYEVISKVPIEQKYIKLLREE